MLLNCTCPYWLVIISQGWGAEAVNTRRLCHPEYHICFERCFFLFFFRCSLLLARGMRNNGSTIVHHIGSVLPHLCTFHKQFPLGTYFFQGHWKSRTKHSTCLMAWLLDFKKAKVGPSPIHLQSTLLYLSLTGKHTDLRNLLTNQFSLFSF